MAESSRRYVGITTRQLRSMFERAWDAAPDGANTIREELRKREDEVTGWMDAGGTYRSSSNGHSAEAFLAGTNTATMAEQLEAWRDLIRRTDTSRWFLTRCNKYGLDPIQVELSPNLLTSSVALQNPVAVTDNDVAEWLMGSIWAAAKGFNTPREWGGLLTPITEAQSDWGNLRTAGPAYA